MTISAILRFRLSFCHLFITFKVGRYSLSQRFQNWFVICWLVSQRFLRSSRSEFRFSQLVKPLYDPIRKWFGVRVSWSSGSVGTCIKGLDFRIHSTSSRRVWNVSSVIFWPLVPRASAELTDFNIVPQLHPIYVAAGGLNSHTVYLIASCLVISSWSIVERAFIRSWLVPMKFRPWSENRTSICPLRTIMRRIAIKHPSVVRQSGISWIAIWSTCEIMSNGIY